MRTRMLKALCGDCAYTVRLTRKWLADAGPPLCPRGHGALECPDWEQLCEDKLLTWEMAQERTRVRILRDTWVDTRARHQCARCREWMEHPDRMRHIVYTVSGDGMRSEYVCLRCDGAAGSPRCAIGRA